jgi:hypothetical protein
MTLATLDAALHLCAQDGRVCPVADAWLALYDLLPGKGSDMYGPIPAPPLVLDAWHASSDEDKRARLHEHLRWADTQGAIDRVHAFLVLLPGSRWHRPAC